MLVRREAVPTRSLARSSCVAIAAALVIGACGGSDSSGASDTLTIYSSFPLQGTSRPQSEAMVNGITLAIEEARGRAGKFKVKYVSLDDSTAAAGKWEPGQVSDNARKAVQDDSAIAYIGESNSGATAISMPITNDGGLLQISPSSTYVGLTRSDGAAPGEPDKYYPSGQRTFGRVMPPDHVDAQAQVTYQKELGCQRLYVLNDEETYGKGVADLVAASAPTLGIQVLANDGLDIKAPNYRAVAQKIKSAGADCMFYGATTANQTIGVWRDVNVANPDMKLFGPAGMADSAFTAEIPESAQRMTHLTSPTIDPKLYPPSGQAFFKAYAKRFGQEPESYAIYGYEAAKLALTAVKRAGDNGNDRQAVIDAFFGIENRNSVFGRYSIDPNGDTTLSTYGGNIVKEGQLVFDKAIDAAPVP
jgi:branched-chain amino acid transport system substrate-binding protein